MLTILPKHITIAFLTWMPWIQLKYKKRFTNSNLSSAPKLESFHYVTQSKKLLNEAKQYFEGKLQGSIRDRR
jgi:hypothetical protein